MTHPAPILKDLKTLMWAFKHRRLIGIRTILKIELLKWEKGCCVVWWHGTETTSHTTTSRNMSSPKCVEEKTWFSFTRFQNKMLMLDRALNTRRMMMLVSLLSIGGARINTKSKLIEKSIVKNRRIPSLIIVQADDWSVLSSSSFSWSHS